LRKTVVSNETAFDESVADGLDEVVEVTPPLLSRRTDPHQELVWSA